MYFYLRVFEYTKPFCLSIRFFLSGLSIPMWPDGGHSWMWVSASQRIPLSALARNAQKVLACEISYETGKRWEKARFQSNQQNIGVSDSQGKATVRERELLKEQLAPEVPEAELDSSRGWASVPGSCAGISLEYTLVIVTDAQRCQKVPKTTPFLRLWLIQARACLFFFLPLTVIYVMTVAHL